MYTRIRELRLKNGFTRKNISDFLGIKLDLYARYEREIHPLPMPYLMKLAQLYGVSIDDILTVADDSDPNEKKRD